MRLQEKPVMPELEKLFEPIRVGNLLLKNRIVLAPMNTFQTTSEGEITESMCDYVNTRAKGGSAMITVGFILVHPNGRAGTTQPCLYDDRFIPGLHRLAKGIQENGALSCAQIGHGGRYGVVGVPVSASDVPAPGLWGKWYEPRALTTEEVEELVELFGDAALRAKHAGFDMVELHGASGYLINQFYSPRTNKRTDKYGGNFENRIRFPLDIIRNIQQKCGVDYPVGIRIIGDEWLPDGFQLEEATLLAKRLEEAGVVYISITAGTHESTPLGEGALAMGSPKGRYVECGAEIKKHVSVPIFINGKITDPIWMNQLIQEGKGDVITLGRPLLSDPDLPVKALQGRLDDIRKCISCCHCLNIMLFWPLECFHNAEMGREREFVIKPAEKPKRVLVIGGGPGGLEAARVAALRGHDVTLMEKQTVLGGQLLLAAIPTGKEEYKTVTVEWLASQCKKGGVKIKLNTECNVKVIEEFKPDALVVATGGVPLVPDKLDIAVRNVMTYEEALTSVKIWKRKKVVVLGGGEIGSETAEFLARKGAQVSIVEILPEILKNMEFQNKVLLKTRLGELGVDIMTRHLFEEIKGNSVIVIDLEKMTKKAIQADVIVIALGVVPNNGLIDDLQGGAVETYVIGDCVKPGKAGDAIHQAAYIARQI
jgi:2,4-dienoyl-CoA reductase-like NADH-dependent reductase (Old Yellow Enzyme family)/thioredoxin reductase